MRYLESNLLMEYRLTFMTALDTHNLLGDRSLCMLSRPHSEGQKKIMYHDFQFISHRYTAIHSSASHSIYPAPVRHSTPLLNDPTTLSPSPLQPPPNCPIPIFIIVDLLPKRRRPHTQSLVNLVAQPNLPAFRPQKPHHPLLHCIGTVQVLPIHLIRPLSSIETQHIAIRFGI